MVRVMEDVMVMVMEVRVMEEVRVIQLHTYCFELYP